MPERIQLRRTKGWRKPVPGINVSRPGKWGNRYHVFRVHYPHLRCSRWEVLDGTWIVSSHDNRRDAIAEAVRLHRRAIEDRRAGFPTPKEIRAELAGENLYCWCPPDQPCHGDTLLEVANEPTW